MAKSCSRMVRQSVTSSGPISNQKAETPMAAKGISTGIEQLLRQQKATVKVSEQLSKQWKEIRNRIDVVLMSNNILKTNETRAKCLELDGMNHNGRIEHIKINWGPLYLNRAQPLLDQLKTIEDQLLKNS